ncbi:MAG: DUF4838 domain-containing protein [Candidatus Omnitrophica bacterium]|nr:DUF4838 domain-containing protein [Candidatus Omnitrophota bacterium]
MQKTSRIMILLILMFTGCAGVAGAVGSKVLARDGAAISVITLAPDASAPERRAAQELASFLKQVTGADFAVKASAEAGNAPQIAVGPGAAKALSPDLSLQGLGADGIIIKVAGAHLILTGGPGAPRGTLYAVYTFLEDQVGCRWWTKSESTIPKKSMLAVDAGLNIRYIPPLERRQTYSMDCFDQDWAARMKDNGFYQLDEARGGNISYAERDCHTFYFLVPPALYFEKHPEWFSEVNGQRLSSGAQLCLTNPEMLQAAVQTAREWLRANPKAKIISVTQNDYHNWCTCPNCKAVDDAEGSPSGTNIRFANAVAEALEKEFPDVLIDTFAYEYTRTPPKLTKPRSNVVVRLCSIECDFAHPLSHPNNKAFREDIEGWSKISKQLYIWDYVTNFYHYLQAQPNLRVLGPNIRFFRDHQVKGVFEQGNGQSLSPSGAVKSWMIAKLLWNPDLDDQKLLQEFLDGYYGPAAPQLRAYIDLVHDEKLLANFFMKISAPPSAPYLAPDILSKSAALFEKAKAAASGQPEFLRRVEVAEMSVLYSQIVNGFSDFLRKDANLNPEALLAKLDRFDAIAARERITNVAEGGDLLPAWADRIRGVVSGRSLKQANRAVELPRGQVNVARLGAEWKVMTDPKEVGVKAKWFAGKFNDSKWVKNRTDLDNGWESQGFPGYVGFGWYRHRFTLPAEFGRKHLYLYFGAIDEEGWIYLNGNSKPVFAHTLESTKLTPAQIWNLPFFCEVTGKLRPGAENLLAVRVYNMMYMGGIWRPVYVVASDAQLTLDEIQTAIK